MVTHMSHHDVRRRVPIRITPRRTRGLRFPFGFPLNHAEKGSLSGAHPQITNHTNLAYRRDVARPRRLDWHKD